MSVPHLNLNERAILSRIYERPDCSNNALAMLTGMSKRGVEIALARLKKRGLIRSKGRGQGRRLMLAFRVEQHIKCGGTANPNSLSEYARN